MTKLKEGQIKQDTPIEIHMQYTDADNMFMFDLDAKMEKLFTARHDSLVLRCVPFRMSPVSSERPEVGGLLIDKSLQPETINNTTK